MKKTTILAMLAPCFAAITAMGQQALPTIYVNERVSTHIVLSEPIAYADISTSSVAGDQPAPKILRLKPLEGADGEGASLGVVTLATGQYLLQYQLAYAPPGKAQKLVLAGSGDGTRLPGTGMGVEALAAHCHRVLAAKRKKPKAKAKDAKVSARLNNVFTVGGYYLLDVSFYNQTNIAYDIGQLRFKIEDRKKTKRANFQQLEITPVYRLYDVASFKKRHRNVLVFERFTFPDSKVFTIELAEEQISGRRVILKIDYADLLRADTI